MFKLILTIECDICGQPLEHIATSCDRDPTAWEYLPAILEATAEGRGWDVFPGHRCDDCIPDVSAHAAKEASLDDDTPF